MGWVKLLFVGRNSSAGYEQDACTDYEQSTADIEQSK